MVNPFGTRSPAAVAASRKALGYNQQMAQPSVRRPSDVNRDQYATDIEELIHPSVERVMHDPIPEGDFRWTWRNKRQAGFAYTVNSFSGGFTRQRGRLQDIAANPAESSLITHHDNDVDLPFLTQSANLDYLKTTTLHESVISTVFQGRAIWALFSGGAVFAETSANDSTPVQILSSYVTPSNQVSLLQVMVIDSIECLVVTTSTRCYAFSSINPPAEHASNTFLIGINGWAQQVPLPKQPILVRTSNEYHLIRSDWNTSSPILSDATKTNTVRSFGSRPVGLGKVGSRPPFVFSIESGGKLAYTDSYGTGFSDFEGIDLPKVYQAAFVREGLVVRDNHRLIYYDGRPWDTRIFRDPVPVSGYFYYLAGFHKVEDSLFAEVNLLPD